VLHNNVGSERFQNFRPKVKADRIVTIWNDTNHTMELRSLNVFNNEKSFIAGRYFADGIDVHVNPMEATPTWSFIPTPYADDSCFIVDASFFLSDTIAGLYFYPSNTTSEQGDVLILYKWHADSPKQDWTWTAPFTNLNYLDFDVSPNGNYIALLITANNYTTSIFYLFSSTSSTPLYSCTYGGESLDVLFSPNSTLVYYVINGTLCIFNIATMKPLWSGMFTPYSILMGFCGDGHNLLVYDGYNTLLCSWNGAGFSNIFTGAVAPDTYFSTAAISTSCETLVIGWDNGDFSNCGITTYNPLTNTTIFQYSFPYSSSGQNVLADITMSPNPNSPITVSIWGDIANTIPQLYVFQPNGGTPASKLLNGSAFVTGTIQNANGTFIALGYKDTHANVMGYGEIAFLSYST